jgi:hypothetical protein
LLFRTNSTIRLVIDENGNYYFTPQFTGNAVTSSSLYIDSNNNRVGVNTQTPTTEFEVNGTVKATLLEGRIDGGTF